METVAKGRKAYQVIAGGRRLAALKLLAKRKEVAANVPVPCHVITEDANANELSLAENALQEPMHPADSSTPSTRSQSNTACPPRTSPPCSASPPPW